MRSKAVLVLLWTLSTGAAVAVVWQSLGFVSTRTDTASGPVVRSTPSGDPGTSGTTTDPAATDPSSPSDPTTSTTPATQGTDASSPTSGSGVPAPPPGAVDQSFSLVGGTALVRFGPDGVEVLAAAAADGFRPEVEPEHGGYKVEFRSEDHRSRLDVWWDGAPRSTISEEAD